MTVADGCSVSGNSTDGFGAAVDAAEAADVAVFFGGLDTDDVEREGHDRVDLGLPGVQSDLIKRVAATGTPVVLVLLNGGAVAIEDVLDDVDCVVEAFYPGKVGAAAIADLLFGAFSPSGKMPYTVFPAAYADETDFKNMSMLAGPGRTRDRRAALALCWPSRRTSPTLQKSSETGFVSSSPRERPALRLCVAVSAECPRRGRGGAAARLHDLSMSRLVFAECPRRRRGGAATRLYGLSTSRPRRGRVSSGSPARGRGRVRRFRRF